jgi:hypothetical protein
MECLERQVGGFMLHGIGQVAALHTFRTWDDGAPAEEDDEDFRLQLKRKAWRVRKYVGDDGRVKNACITLYVTLPIDHLWRHLQWCEEHGAALQDLVISRLNFFEVPISKHSHLSSRLFIETCPSGRPAFLQGALTVSFLALNQIPNSLIQIERA